MPTPDKTMDDVSKLVSEARHLAASEDSDWNGTALDKLCDVYVPALCDALESVAKENAELKEQRGKEANGYLKLINQVAHLDYDNADLTGRLAAVAKERDALREQVSALTEKLRVVGTVANTLNAALVDRLTTIQDTGCKTDSVLARNALEKLNAK